MSVIIEGVSRRFESHRAVDDVSFEIPTGELAALVGPSGSGKSTILRIIAGLEPADSGRVKLDNQDVTGLAVQGRGIGFVFQNYALFRHMTVRQNVAFGLEVRKEPRALIRSRVAELLELVRMADHGDRYPSQLSGGQRQRVALARALAPRPAVLLLDEPFGALDAMVREELRNWLREFHDEVRVTTLLVTHDQREAFEVADRVIVLNHGRVEQVGPPQSLYEHPVNPFVAEFLGGANVLRGRSEQGRSVLLGGVALTTGTPGPDGPVSIFIRPHDLDLTREHVDAASWPARVMRLVPLGASERIEIHLEDGTSLGVELTRDRSRGLALTPGESVFVTPRAPKVFHGEEISFDSGSPASVALQDR